MSLPSLRVAQQNRDEQPTVVLFDGVGLQLLLAYGRPLQRPANGKLRRNPVLPSFAGKRSPFSTVATTSASVAPRSSKRRAACGCNRTIIGSRADPWAWSRVRAPWLRGALQHSVYAQRPVPRSSWSSCGFLSGATKWVCTHSRLGTRLANGIAI